MCSLIELENGAWIEVKILPTLSQGHLILRMISGTFVAILSVNVWLCSSHFSSLHLLYRHFLSLQLNLAHPFPHTSPDPELNTELLYKPSPSVTIALLTLFLIIFSGANLWLYPSFTPSVFEVEISKEILTSFFILRFPFLYITIIHL